MASLSADSWTVLLLHASGEAQNANARPVDMSVLKRHKIVNAIMILATGESPAGGIPWPTPGKFGFYRNLDSIILHNQKARLGATVGAISASGVHVVFQSNATGQDIRVYNSSTATGTSQRALKQLATTVTITGGARLYVTAMGWIMAGVAVMLPALFGGQVI